MSFDPLAILRSRFAQAIGLAVPEHAGADPLIAPGKNPAFGDFQCNAAMSLGKLVGKPPREVAGWIVRHAAPLVGDVAEPLTEASIAGPGFINIKLRTDALADLLNRLDTPTLGIDPPAIPPTVVVDLCGVNLAKQMHIGHLRSTVIGDTLARVLERLGARVIRQNHVGDWGLPIAMVTARLMDESAAGRLDLARITLDDLDRAYRAAQRECERDAKGLAAARAWGMGPKALAELEEQVAGAEERYARAQAVLVRLQRHDRDVYAVWQRISDVTMSACLAICARLNARVLPEHSAGESSYAGLLAPLVADLEGRGIAEPSDGALVVRLNDAGIEEPLLVRKRDGGFLYATTDLAAIRHRAGTLGASRIVYCVDARQSLHFRQVFAGAHKAGYDRTPGGEPAKLEHAAFGTILGDDGRPFKTRSGENVRLNDVIDEAEQRALAAIEQKNADLPADAKPAVARAVAVAAMRYTDLSSERTKDYVFNYDRMLAFEGDTGPYLLYALVRIRSIFRKATERSIAAPADAPLAVAQPAEKSLALALLRYPQAVRDAGTTLEPHRLCQYLSALAAAFSAFFDACPVLAAPDEPTRGSRLRLCRITERVLADGLDVLGIPTLERM